ncbi:MAG: 6,7-dimethyl-8-ribityllumazine synthase, partial [Porticoccus sp.]|nr:6,7-dimethyl-8-ribityllumazine synthase [Porticoccus sp.]
MSIKYIGKNNTLKVNIDQTTDIRIAIVASNWNSNITDNLIEGAKFSLKSSGVPKKNIDIFRVPGAFELPLACQKLTTRSKISRYEGIIALGCVVRGETPHFDYVCQETTRGLGEVALKTNIPVGFGLLTVDNLAQARHRACLPEESVALVQSNKGQEAADAVLAMI